METSTVRVVPRGPIVTITSAAPPPAGSAQHTLSASLFSRASYGDDPFYVSEPADTANILPQGHARPWTPQALDSLGFRDRAPIVDSAPVSDPLRTAPRPPAAFEWLFPAPDVAAAEAAAAEEEDATPYDAYNAFMYRDEPPSPRLAPASALVSDIPLAALAAALPAPPPLTYCASRYDLTAASASGYRASDCGDGDGEDDDAAAEAEGADCDEPADLHCEAVDDAAGHPLLQTEVVARLTARRGALAQRWAALGLTPRERARRLRGWLLRRERGLRLARFAREILLLRALLEAVARQRRGQRAYDAWCLQHPPQSQHGRGARLAAMRGEAALRAGHAAVVAQMAASAPAAHGALLGGDAVARLGFEAWLQAKQRRLAELAAAAAAEEAAAAAARDRARAARAAAVEHAVDAWQSRTDAGAARAAAEATARKRTQTAAAQTEHAAREAAAEHAFDGWARQRAAATAQRLSATRRAAAATRARESAAREEERAAADRAYTNWLGARREREGRERAGLRRLQAEAEQLERARRAAAAGSPSRHGRARVPAYTTRTAAGAARAATARALLLPRSKTGGGGSTDVGANNEAAAKAGCVAVAEGHVRLLRRPRSVAPMGRAEALAQLALYAPRSAHTGPGAFAATADGSVTVGGGSAGGADAAGGGGAVGAARGDAQTLHAALLARVRLAQAARQAAFEGMRQKGLVAH